MNNSLFKKGLVSLAAASVLGSAMYAASTINSGTVSNYAENSADFNTTYTMGQDFNITETYNDMKQEDFETITITIPDSFNLINIDTNGTTGEMNVSAGSWPLSSGNVYYESISGGSAFSLTLDYNSSNTVRLIDDFNTTANLADLALYTSATTPVYADSANTGWGDDLNGTKVGTFTADSDGIAFTFNVQATTSSSVSQVSLYGLNLQIAGTSVGDTPSISVAGSNGYVSSTTISPITTVYAASLELNDTTVNNVPASSGQTASDFNITLADNLISAEGNVTVTLNAPLETCTAYGASTYEVYTGDDNKTILFNHDATGGSYSAVNFACTIDASDIAVDSYVTAYISTGDRNFSSPLPSSSTTINIARVVEDGADVELGESGKTNDSYVVSPGANAQLVNDLNITEYFYNTIDAGDYITLEITNDGVTWNTIQNSCGVDVNPASVIFESDAENTNYSYGNYAQVSTDGKTLTLQFSDSNDSSQCNNLYIDDNETSDTSTTDSVYLQDLKVNVDSTATEDTYVSVTVSGTGVANIGTSIEVARIDSAVASLVSDYSGKDASSYYAGLENDATDANLSITVGNGADLGDSLKITLSSGAYFESGAIGSDISGETTTYLNDPGTRSTTTNSNDTLAYTFKSGTSDDANLTFNMPDIDVTNVAAGTTVTATVSYMPVGGSYTSIGEVDVVDVLDSTNQTSYNSTCTAVSAGSIGYGSDVNLTEGCATCYGSSFDAGDNIIVISVDEDLATFPVLGTVMQYSVDEGANYSTVDVSDANVSVVASGGSSKLYIDLNLFSSSLSSSAVDNILIQPRVEVNSAASGYIPFDLTVNQGTAVSALSGMNLLYAGDSCPTSDATVSYSAGWSLLSGPAEYSDLDNATAVWKLGTLGIFEQVTSGSIDDAAGFWLYATDSGSYDMNSSAITGESDYTFGATWELMGAPVELDAATLLTNCGTNCALYTYDATIGTFSNTTSGTISAGAGFWIYSE